MARQSGLGRGIGALIPTEEGDSGGSALYQELPIDVIQPNSYQPRKDFDEASLEELTESIRKQGVLQPIRVRPHPSQGFELIAGERRWRAAQRAGLKQIPAVVQTTEDSAALQQALIENLQRADLNPMEEASAYQELINEFGLTQEQVSTQVGKSRSAVANTLRLLRLPKSTQTLVRDATLSAGHARALLAVENSTALASLAARVVKEQLNVRQTEELVAESLNKTSKNSSNKGKTKLQSQDPTVLELEELLSEHLHTKVQVTMGKGRGKLLVEFADLDDLERIYRAMLGTNEAADH